MGYNIGFFRATKTGFVGKIQTLVHNLDEVEFHRVVSRKSEKAPAIEGYVGDMRIAAAWEYSGKYGTFYKVSFEDPSFSTGEYFLNRNRGVEDGWTLSFERTRRNREDKPELASAA
jgi:uncharacterized protein (DUF736 family)